MYQMRYQEERKLFCKINPMLEGGQQINNAIPTIRFLNGLYGCESLSARAAVVSVIRSL